MLKEKTINANDNWIIAVIYGDYIKFGEFPRFNTMIKTIKSR